MSERAENFGISRLEQAASGTFGWQVRMQRRGMRFGKYFADRNHGGWDQSLQAARAWRDELLRRLDEEAAGSRVCALSVRNSSGVVGVARVAVSGPQGAVYHFWQATWCPEPGERRSIRFSVRRHGDEAAFLLAFKARRGGTGA